MFDNFAKLIQKEVEECEKTELECLLLKWNKKNLTQKKEKLEKEKMIVTDLMVIKLLTILRKSEVGREKNRSCFVLKYIDKKKQSQN